MRKEKEHISIGGYYCYCYKESDGLWYSGMWNAKDWREHGTRYGDIIASILEKLDSGVNE